MAATKITEKAQITLPDGSVRHVPVVDYTDGEPPIVALVINAKGFAEMLALAFTARAKELTEPAA